MKLKVIKKAGAIVIQGTTVQLDALGSLMVTKAHAPDTMSATYTDCDVPIHILTNDVTSTKLSIHDRLSTLEYYSDMDCTCAPDQKPGDDESMCISCTANSEICSISEILADSHKLLNALRTDEELE